MVLNYIFVQDMLVNAHGEKIILKMNTNSLPIIFLDEDKEFLYLIIPIKNS